MLKKFGFFAFIVFIILYPLKAQTNEQLNTPEEETSYIINDIEISGLKRTKKYIAEEPLKKFIGQNALEIDFNDIRTAIIETGILEPLSVEIEDDQQKKGKILKVVVHEKWSIFPIPVFFANSHAYGGGLGFMDFNALGINDKFLFGGMISTEGWLAATMYIHTPGTSSSLGWNILFFYSKQERTDSDEKDNDIRRFGVKRLFTSVGLNYRITDPASAILNLSFVDAKIYNIDNPFSVPENNEKLINLNPGLKIQKNNWDGYFLSQKKIEINYTYSFGIDSSSFQEINIETNYEKSIIPGFRMFSRAGMIYSPDAPPLFESRPGAIEIDILPQSFSAKNYIGGSAGLEKCIFKSSYGILSLLSSYQVVYSDGPILGERIDHGALGAVRFYLRKIAIPAFGLGVSYNVSEKYLQAAFSMGMSF